MISTGVLVLLVVSAVVVCLILAWHTRRWPDPQSGSTPFGRLRRDALKRVVFRQTAPMEQEPEA